MNIRTSHMLAAILSVGVLVLSPAFAQELPCLDCDDSHRKAIKQLLEDLPVSVWTDTKVYDHDSIIMLQGMVGHLKKDSVPVTITVSSPLNNIIVVKQIEPNSDRTYSTTMKTSGALWKYDGAYTIRVQYGASSVNNKVLVQLTGGVDTIRPPVEQVPSNCTSNELTLSGQCIPFSITGGSVTGGEINSGTSIVLRISAPEPGMLTLSPTPGVFRDLELVFVDGEQWDEVEVVGDSITIQFPAGAQEVEIVGGFVIPEFGTIAALILAVAIISIIAISARSRLSIMPKY